MHNKTSDISQYIHGSSPKEHHRLSLLNELLNKACLQELNISGGEKILDVGSGLGQFTRMMAQATGESGVVVGVERDIQQIAQAKELAKEAKELDLVEFRQGNALSLPLKDNEWGSFNLAHSRFLLEHLSHPAEAISQMVSSVRPGGRIFISDDDHEHFCPWPEPPGFHALWHAYMRSYDRLGNDPYIGRRLVFLLHDSGLKFIRNTSVFFGGCAGNERFDAVSDNLIGVIEGAKETILSNELLDSESYSNAIDGLKRWKNSPSAALWYTVCCAEGTVS